MTPAGKVACRKGQGNGVPPMLSELQRSGGCRRRVGAGWGGRAHAVGCPGHRAACPQGGVHEDSTAEFPNYGVKTELLLHHHAPSRPTIKNQSSFQWLPSPDSGPTTHLSGQFPTPPAPNTGLFCRARGRR